MQVRNYLDALGMRGISLMFEQEKALKRYEEKEDICYFDKDIRNFIKEVRELKSKYIDV